jgi:TctA family transporter
MEDRQLLGWMNLRVYPTFAMFIAFFMIFAPIFAFVSVSKWWSDNSGIDQIIQIGLLIVLISVSLFTLLMAWSLIFDMKALVSSMSAELASSDFGKTFKGFVAFGVVFTILILGTAVGLGLLVFSADFRS